MKSADEFGHFMRDLLPRLPYAVLAVAVALGAAAAANWASREPSSLHRISGAVLRAKWDHRGAHAQQAQQIAAARTPLVLTDSPAAHWPALASWRDVAYLSTYLPVLSDVIISPGSDAHRYWSQEAPLAHLLPEPPQAMVRRTSAFGEVFGLLRAGTPLYWSRALEMDELRSVPAADLAPSDFLRVDRASAGNSSNVWIGGNGVTTAMHFDASHNFFLQIVGTKTFVVAPPSAHQDLALFPFVHPLGIFTQRTSRTLEAQPHAPPPPPPEALIDGFTATLGPGDLLYIPPLWFHMATAGAGASVAVNLWSNSAEGDVAATLDAPPLPNDLFDPSTPPKLRDALLDVTVDALLAAALRLDERHAQAAFLRGSLVARFSRAFGALAPACSAACMPPEPLLDRHARQIAAHAGAVSAAFDELPAAVSRGARELQALMMIEGLAAAALGLEEADELAPAVCRVRDFLHCFCEGGGRVAST